MPGTPDDAGHRVRRALGTALAVAAVLVAGVAHATTLAETISVSGDSISRGFDANTSSCNYGDNVSRAWATGVDDGTSFCSAGPNGTFSHAERLQCAKGATVTVFNDAASGADMLNDFFNQASSIKLHLSSNLGPRYVPVFMGHNDACTNTTSKTGNSCSGDQDPNNYCRTTNAAFEREFRRGMDQLIQIPGVRIGVLALVRVSELCNFGSKSTCGVLGIGGNCSNIWGVLNICASLTTDCSNQRRIDMYDTLVGYNEILERVTNEYAALPSGGISATGAVKAPDVQIRFGGGSFNYKFSSGDVSCCDCFHPDDAGQAKLAQFTWDGLQCTPASPCCAPSADPLTNATCGALDTTTFYPGGFWPGSMPCGNGILDPGEDCDDGNTVDGDCCSSTCHLEASGSACASDGNPCTNDVCNGAGACTHVANAASCDDGNPCTHGDVCSGGTCAGTPVACPAQDQCHVAGTCDPASGLCSNPPKPDGSACTDGNACTQTDTCQGGVCTGTNPVTCTAADQCHVAGTCNPLSGLCSNPAKPDGSGCTDGDACTQTDTCQSGTCTGTNPVVCTAQDQCHVAGTCNPASGACSNPTKPDGSACADGDACTQTDACQGGTCTGTNPVVCTAQDQCHLAGTCNPATGACSSPAKPDGAACDDGSACTQADACASGVCTGGSPVVCTAADQCHDAGTCDPASGACSNPAKADGSPCDDGNACTVADRCDGGTCSGGSASCGDGVVQAGCAEECDDGAGNGTDGCCSATCGVVDTDGDGLCDRDDPCTGGAPLMSPRAAIGRLSTPPGDDTLSFRATATLPAQPSPPLDPVANGVRLLVRDQARTLVDATIPGGAYAGTAGWVASSSGTKWTYRNRSTAPGTITRVLVQLDVKHPGLVRFQAKARAGSYGLTPADLPLGATVVLDPPSATTGECGEVTFTGPAPAPACSFGSSGKTLKCS
jgi:cysteine-rich repeat protein